MPTYVYVNICLHPRIANYSLVYYIYFKTKCHVFVFHCMFYFIVCFVSLNFVNILFHNLPTPAVVILEHPLTALVQSVSPVAESQLAHT